MAKQKEYIGQVAYSDKESLGEGRLRWSQSIEEVFGWGVRERDGKRPNFTEPRLAKEEEGSGVV